MTVTGDRLLKTTTTIHISQAHPAHPNHVYRSVHVCIYAGMIMHAEICFERGREERERERDGSRHDSAPSSQPFALLGNKNQYS